MIFGDDTKRKTMFLGKGPVIDPISQEDGIGPDLLQGEPLRLGEVAARSGNRHMGCPLVDAGRFQNPPQGSTRPLGMEGEDTGADEQDLLLQHRQPFDGGEIEMPGRRDRALYLEPPARQVHLVIGHAHGAELVDGGDGQVPGIQIGRVFKEQRLQIRIRRQDSPPFFCPGRSDPESEGAEKKGHLTGGHGQKLIESSPFHGGHLPFRFVFTLNQIILG